MFDRFCKTLNSKDEEDDSSFKRSMMLPSLNSPLAQDIRCLKDVWKPQTLITFKFTNKEATAISLWGLVDFKNLLELDLSNNCISSDIEDFKHLKFLKKVNLSFNFLSSIEVLPPNLENLNLSNNRIQTLDFLSPKFMITILDVSFNQITSLQGI